MYKKELDLNYPYIEHHKVWNNEFDFIISNFQAEDWYGVLGYQNRIGCDEKTARKYWNNWNRNLRKLINDGDIAIDCGAHHGHISLAMSYIASKVIAIEADPFNAEILSKNIALNHRNIASYNRAVANISGEFVGVRHECIYLHGDKNIETMALDDLGILPNVIKIDIEGYEVPAILGAQTILKTSRPKFEIELHLIKRGVDMRSYGYYPSQLLSILLDNNYCIFRNNKQIESMPANIDTGGCIYAIPCELINPSTTINFSRQQNTEVKLS